MGPRRARAIGVVLVVFGMLLCSGCGSDRGSTASAIRNSAIGIYPSPDARGVDPRTPVRVSLLAGELDSVTLTDEAGKQLDGTITGSGTCWRNAQPLDYGRSYTVRATGHTHDGEYVARTIGFATLKPQNKTKVYLRTTGGDPIADSGVYGVGMVVVAHFDEAETDHRAAEQRLEVTTDPPVAGSWYWLDDKDAHWRPEHYYTPGTRVSVTANVYGYPLGGGLYGEQDTHVSFSIGDAHISVADDNTKQVTVFENGVPVRTMPTSMGRGGSTVVDNQTISFWTQPGVYTVLDKANPVVMDSSSFGLPVNNSLGYKQTVNYATRISNDGVYLHQLDATIWAQGNTDTSHGCLNLNGDNARWFYRFSMPGDVVEVLHTGGAPLTVAQNGDWTLPWDQWRHGSAMDVTGAIAH